MATILVEKYGELLWEAMSVDADTNPISVIGRSPEEAVGRLIMAFPVLFGETVEVKE